MNTEGYAQIVTNLRTFIDKFAPQRVEELGKLVRVLGHERASFREGAEWTLRYLANHADEFTSASKINFEVGEQLKLGKRTADMVVKYPDLPPVYYEFKSVRSVPPKDFAEQFSKDLSRPDFDLNNLKWVFDGRKITRQDLEKLIPEIDKVLQKNMSQITKQERYRYSQRLIQEIFMVI